MATGQAQGTWMQEGAVLKPRRPGLGCSFHEKKCPFKTCTKNLKFFNPDSEFKCMTKNIKSSQIYIYKGEFYGI